MEDDEEPPELGEWNLVAGSIHGPLAGYIEMFLVEGKPNETARRLSELNKLLLLQGDVQSQDKMFNNVKDWMSEMSVKNKYELPAKVAQQLAQAGYSEMVIRDKDLRAFWDFNCWLDDTLKSMRQAEEVLGAVDKNAGPAPPPGLDAAASSTGAAGEQIGSSLKNRPRWASIQEQGDGSTGWPSLDQRQAAGLAAAASSTGHWHHAGTGTGADNAGFYDEDSDEEEPRRAGAAGEQIGSSLKNRPRWASIQQGDGSTGWPSLDQRQAAGSVPGGLAAAASSTGHGHHAGTGTGADEAGFYNEDSDEEEPRRAGAAGEQIGSSLKNRPRWASIQQGDGSTGWPSLDQRQAAGLAAAASSTGHGHHAGTGTGADAGFYNEDSDEEEPGPQELTLVDVSQGEAERVEPEVKDGVGGGYIPEHIPAAPWPWPGAYAYDPMNFYLEAQYAAELAAMQWHWPLDAQDAHSWPFSSHPTGHWEMGQGPAKPSRGRKAKPRVAGQGSGTARLSLRLAVRANTAIPQAKGKPGPRAGRDHVFKNSHLGRYIKDVLDENSEFEELRKDDLADRHPSNVYFDDWERAVSPKASIETSATILILSRHDYFPMQQEISYDIPDLRTTFPRAHTYLLAVDEADGQSENPFIEKLKEKIFECCKKEVNYETIGTMELHPRHS
ncbi:unnamed protein product [Symbiodinium natans]|uniref:Uncharacterized protein n=1 Tax=Symbiodinium natans TaxID=878477 RepID=A0A812K2Y8_9DINO|nr:unnamed protein product [Symbiodinium natans]